MGSDKSVVDPARIGLNAPESASVLTPHSTFDAVLSDTVIDSPPNKQNELPNLHLTDPEGADTEGNVLPPLPVPDGKTLPSVLAENSEAAATPVTVDPPHSRLHAPASGTEFVAPIAIASGLTATTSLTQQDVVGTSRTLSRETVVLGNPVARAELRPYTSNSATTGQPIAPLNTDKTTAIEANPSTPTRPVVSIDTTPMTPAVDAARVSAVTMSARTSVVQQASEQSTRAGHQQANAPTTQSRQIDVLPAQNTERQPAETIQTILQSPKSELRSSTRLDAVARDSVQSLREQLMTTKSEPIRPPVNEQLAVAESRKSDVLPQSPQPVVPPLAPQPKLGLAERFGLREQTTRHLTASSTPVSTASSSMLGELRTEALAVPKPTITRAEEFARISERAVGSALLASSSTIAAAPVQSSPSLSPALSIAATAQTLEGLGATPGNMALAQSSVTAMDDVQAQVQRFIALRAASQGQVTLQLHPRELGRLDIDFRHDSGEVQIQISARETATREILESVLPKLRASLSEAGVNLGSLHVRDEQEQRHESKGQPNAQDTAMHRSDEESIGTASSDSADPLQAPGRIHITV